MQSGLWACRLRHIVVNNGDTPGNPVNPALTGRKTGAPIHLRRRDSKDSIFAGPGSVQMLYARRHVAPFGEKLKGKRMPWDRIGSTVVVIANRFNPSIFSQIWLSDNNIVTRDEFLPNFVLNEMVAQVPTTRFDLLVIQEQLQFLPHVPEDQEQELITQKVGGIVGLLPQTPFRALGLNFNWHLTPRDGDIGRLSRELFSSPDKPLYRRFGSPTDHFGAYFSTDLAGFRLKLDVKPVIVPHGEQILNRLQFLFNYHVDLRENAAAAIPQHLARWNELRRESGSILDLVEPRN